jgi:hypothetical protein
VAYRCKDVKRLRALSSRNPAISLLLGAGLMAIGVFLPWLREVGPGGPPSTESGIQFTGISLLVMAGLMATLACFYLAGRRQIGLRIAILGLTVVTGLSLLFTMNGIGLPISGAGISISYDVGLYLVVLGELLFFVGAVLTFRVRDASQPVAQARSAVVIDKLLATGSTATDSRTSRLAQWSVKIFAASAVGFVAGYLGLGAVVGKPLVGLVVAAILLLSGGGSIGAVITGHMARSQMRNSLAPGRRHATIGMVGGYVVLGIFLVTLPVTLFALAYSMCNPQLVGDCS